MLSIKLLSILSLKYFATGHSNSKLSFNGELTIPNGTNSTNTTIPSLSNFIKQNLTCEILTIDDSQDTLSLTRDIVIPPSRDKVYYNIEHHSCIKFNIAKTYEHLHAKFEFDDERDPKLLTKFEIIEKDRYTVSWVSRYHVNYTRTNKNYEKLYFGFDVFYLASNLSLGLWFKFSRNRVQFGYDGNDDPIRNFSFNPKNLILYPADRDSAIFVIKDAENCSAIRPTAQRLITRCEIKDDDINDDDNIHNGSGNDTEHANGSSPYQNVTLELLVLVQQQNATYRVLLSDKEVEADIFTYQNITNGIRDFLQRQSELLDEAIRVHKLIMEFQPRSAEDKKFIYDYFMSNLYSTIRHIYFRRSLKIRSTYGID